MLINFTNQGQSRSFYIVFVSRMNALCALPHVWLNSNTGPVALCQMQGLLETSIDKKGVVQKVSLQGDLIANS